MNFYKKIIFIIPIAAILVLSACNDGGESIQTSSPFEATRITNNAVSLSEIPSEGSLQNINAQKIRRLNIERYCMSEGSKKLCAYTNGLTISNSKENWELNLKWTEVGVSVLMSADDRRNLAIAVVSEHGSFVFGDDQGITDGRTRTASFVEAAWRLHNQIRNS